MNEPSLFRDDDSVSVLLPSGLESEAHISTVSLWSCSTQLICNVQSSKCVHSIPAGIDLWMIACGEVSANVKGVDTDSPLSPSARQPRVRETSPPG